MNQAMNNKFGGLQRAVLGYLQQKLRSKRNSENISKVIVRIFWDLRLSSYTSGRCKRYRKA